LESSTSREYSFIPKQPGRDFLLDYPGYKVLTGLKNGNIWITIQLEKVLREPVKKRGLRKVVSELGIIHSSLHRSIQDGSNVGLERVEAILNLFGYELKISKQREVIPRKLSRSKEGA
jgi:DNA-binding phage protein